MSKELTKIQNKIRETEGKYVVRACPGSGKTFTVAAKMAKLLKNWPYSHQGVAVISFTNVAWQEIEKELKKSFSINIPIKHPHFLRTIDSFINQFIFFPYGHLALNCKNRPVLVGEPSFSWKIKRSDNGYHQYFDRISFDINGNIIQTQTTPYNQFFFGTLKKINKDNSLNGHYTNIKEMKKKYLEKGYANQSDADYFSMKLLESYPSIAKLIALRFPFIIIDEAQDTSEIQMKIIDIIAENGLKNLILVGDPDQAIFEWNSANPELFNEKAEKWQKILMNENWRSSQNICNFTYFLTELNKPSTSINSEVADYTHNPEIWDYDINNVDFYEDLINPFLKICEEKKITLNASKIAILARSRNLINKIILSRNGELENNGINRNGFNIWHQDKFTKELARSKYLYDKSEFQKSFKLLEKTYMSILKQYTVYSDYKLSKMIEKRGYFDFKEEIFNLIKLMPKTDISIEEWINKFKLNSNDNESFPNLDLKIKEECGNLSFNDLFSYDITTEYPYNLSTIHKVKGETFEAVLLILKQKSNGPYYRTLLRENRKTSFHEELRNVYVGITRPRKVLILAVPSEDKNEWEAYFSEKRQVEEPQKTLDKWFS